MLTAKLLQIEEAGKHKGKKLVMVKIVLVYFVQWISESIWSTTGI